MSRTLRVVVTDPIIARFEDDLRRTASPHAWRFLPGRPPAEIARALADADVVVCSRLDAAATASAARLALVHATGAGHDRIEPGAVPRSAALCNTGHHGRAIAEHVLMVSLMLRRRVLDADAQLRRGEWRTIGTDPAVPFHRTLAGGTMGLLGIGEIGAEVARLAAAFGMTAIALRRRPGAPAPDGVDLARVYGGDELHDFLAASDIVVVTVPLDDATRGLLGAAEFAAVRDDAIVVNVARGGILDEDALVEALRTGGIGGAAVDVWWDAPQGTTAPPSVSRLADLPRTVLTPHFSGHAREVFVARSADIARNIDLLAAGRPLERRVR